MTSLVPIGGLAKIDRPTLEPIATEMARAYLHETARIRTAMLTIEECSQALHESFCGGDESFRIWDFNIGYNHRGRDHCSAEQIFEVMKRTAWHVLADRLGIKNVMSMDARKKFEKQLAEDDLPEITPENIIQVIMGLANQAESFVQEAVREVFEFLRGRRDDYKTNLQYRIGRKVILSYAVEQAHYGGAHFRASYHKDDFYRALDGVMLVLDGKTILRDGKTNLTESIRKSDNTGRGESDYFKFRCFKNQNLHLQFKREDLLRQLNLIATGSAEIGDDER